MIQRKHAGGTTMTLFELARLSMYIDARGCREVREPSPMQMSTVRVLSLQEMAKPVWNSAISFSFE
jgi:hypothetical protein